MMNFEVSIVADATIKADAHRTEFRLWWLLWAGLLAGAMVWGHQQGHGKTGPTALRMASSGVLVVTAWRAATLLRNTAVSRFALAIAIGMTLGAIGDLFNAGWLEFVPLPDATLGGILAFGLGHVAYIAGSFQLAARARLNNWQTLGLAIVVWQLVGLGAWYAVVMTGTERRPLVWPALGYTLLLAGTAGVTCGLALQNRRLAPLALGAVLFLVSDLILAFALFRGPFSYQTECVWLTYGPGQMLIVFSVLAAVVSRSERSPIEPAV